MFDNLLRFSRNTEKSNILKCTFSRVLPADRR